MFMIARYTGVCPVVLATILSTVHAQDSQPAAYTFLMDGKPYSRLIFSLNGTPDQPEPGDIIILDRIALVLGPAGKYEFRMTPKEDGRLLLALNGGPEHTVGVFIGHYYKDKEFFDRNPLKDLSKEELRDLRGVSIEKWVPELEEQLRGIDVNQCAITVEGGTQLLQLTPLPPLPRGLRYLYVGERSNHGIGDYTSLNEYKDLRFLILSSMSVRNFDLALLKDCTQLRYLEVGHGCASNAESLEGLRELRILDLSWSERIDNVAFAKGMKHLRSLGISGTKVEDLTPLGGLPALASVEASMSLISKLPAEHMPALCSLDAMSSRLSDEQVAAFAKEHPQCRVAHRWAQLLAQEAQGATRIRVRSGGTCHRHPDKEKTLFEVKSADEIKEVLDHIKIDEPNSNKSCMCCGEPSIEFYRGDELLLTIGVHHGKTLRWPGGWPDDAQLTRRSAIWICDWLARNGVPGPKKERSKWW